SVMVPLGTPALAGLEVALPALAPCSFAAMQDSKVVTGRF
ncbi:hypothetical protein AVDCRST_MAG94-6363, partial [uncultured Leptolyngbya sp.]